MRQKRQMMYIEIHDWKQFEQKVLYFKINNSFNMNMTSELNHKIAGIYAIYKDDNCVYVGQSKNLASRIATHLKGKYENVSNVYAWNIESIGFPKFRTYTKEIQEQLLIKSEKYLMTVLKPVENLDIDMDFIIYDNQKPTFNFDASSCFTIQLTDLEDLRITDSYPYNTEEIKLGIDWLTLSNKIDKSTEQQLESMLEVHALRYFYDLGVES